MPSLDMRILYKGSCKKLTGFDILVWMNYHEVDYMLFTIFVPISKVHHVEFNVSSDSY